MTLAAPAASIQSEEPVIEMRADRVLIYPQRMALTGEETLLDLLLMFPDQMQSGFDKMIDAYSLRLDNVALNGNTRLLCTQLKAKDISKVQICDNTGVAKGTVGMGRVIDVNLLRMKEGAHGFVSAQYGTDNTFAPSAQVMLGTEKTDIFANASYTYQNKFSQQRNDQYLSLHMTNWFSSRDRLLTYFTQQYKDDRAYSSDKAMTLTKKYLGKARYFHNFNDMGTELAIEGCYIYSNAPKTIYYDDSRNVTGTSDNSLIGMVELNTPLGSRKLDMMLGWEGDWSFDTYHGETKAGAGALPAAFEHRYMSSNNDFYLQYDYQPTTHWSFSAGARMMLFHYGADGNSHNDARWNFIASAICKPTANDQIQLGYFRKFFNPSYSVNAEVSADDWMDMQGRLVACNIDELKMAYTYSRKEFTVNLASSYFFRNSVDDVWTPASYTYYYIDDMWKTSASVSYKKGILSLTAGANYYWLNNDQSYAAFTLAPTLSMPCKLQIAPKVLLFTKNITAGTYMVALPYADCRRTYASLQLNKQLGDHFDVMASWHDIFSSRYSAVLIGVQCRF